MNILLINPPGAKSKRDQFDVCKIIRNNYNVKCYVTYVNDFKPKIDEEYFFSYKDWVHENKDMIRNKDIHELEQEFSRSNLWTIIVSQRTFFDYSYLDKAEPYSNPKIKDTIYHLKAMVMFYSFIIKKYNIDTVLAHAGDNMHSATLFIISKSMDFNAYQSNAIFLNDTYYYLCDDEYFRSSLLKRKHLKNYDGYDKYIKPNEKKIENFKKQLIGFDPVQENAGGFWPKVNLFKMLANNLKSLKKILLFWKVEHPGFEEVNKIKVIFIKSFSAIRRYWNYIITENFIRFEKRIEDNKMIYFPLHLQPEATLLNTTPVFSDQLSVVRALSASIPSGYYLAVKDYPLQAGYRPFTFYKQIKRLPNVKLFHRNFKSSLLTEKCDLLVTISGSAGFEAALRMKKVLLMGKTFYESIFGIKIVNDYKDLHFSIKEALLTKIDKVKMEKSINAFLAAILEITLKRKKDKKNNNEDMVYSAERLLKLLKMQKESN